MDSALADFSHTPLSSPSAETSMMPILLQSAGWISLVAGVIGFFVFFPGEAEYGYSWKAAAYIPAVSSLVAGILQALLLGALGTIIGYLETISKKEHLTTILASQKSTPATITVHATSAE